MAVWRAAFEPDKRCAPRHKRRSDGSLADFIVRKVEPQCVEFRPHGQGIPAHASFPEAMGDGGRRKTCATLSAVASTWPIGAMRSAHDHQNHSDPSSAVAAYTFSESCAVTLLTTRTQGGPPPSKTVVTKPRLDRSELEITQRCCSTRPGLLGVLISVAWRILTGDVVPDGHAAADGRHDHTAVKGKSTEVAVGQSVRSCPIREARCRIRSKAQPKITRLTRRGHWFNPVTPTRPGNTRIRTPGQGPPGSQRHPSRTVEPRRMEPSCVSFHSWLLMALFGRAWPPVPLKISGDDGGVIRSCATARRRAGPPPSTEGSSRHDTTRTGASSAKRSNKVLLGPCLHRLHPSLLRGLYGGLDPVPRPQPPQDLLDV